MDVQSGLKKRDKKKLYGIMLDKQLVQWWAASVGPTMLT